MLSADSARYTLGSSDKRCVHGLPCPALQALPIQGEEETEVEVTWEDPAQQPAEVLVKMQTPAPPPAPGPCSGVRGAAL